MAQEIAEGEKLQDQILEVIQSELGGLSLIKNQGEFTTTLSAALKKHDLKLRTPVSNEIVQVLSERDETADVVT